MTLHAGDREYGHGDQLTVKNTSGTDLDAGVPVEVTGHDGSHPEVGRATTSGDADAVLADPVADGELGEAKRHAVVWAKVSGSPSAGGTVGEGATEFEAAGSEYTVLEAGVTDPEYGYDIALIAFEGK